MLFKCFIVKKFMSKNRSTQFFKHPSSVLSSLPFLIEPVTHFVQQICVRLCVSTVSNSLVMRPFNGLRLLSSRVHRGKEKNVRDWICERCCSLARNWRRSALSLSLRRSRSMFSSPVEAAFILTMVFVSCFRTGCDVRLRVEVMTEVDRFLRTAKWNNGRPTSARSPANTWSSHERNSVN